MTPKKTHEHWDLRIRPNSPLLDLHLKDVWNYRDLLALLVRRDFVSFYKQTILGPVWFFLQPLLTTVMYVFIFGRLAGLSTDGLPQPLFYLAGIVAWNYFAECLTKTSSVFRDNANIFGKVYFPRLIMPLSIVVSNLVRFGVQFLLLICMLVYYAFFRSSMSAQYLHLALHSKFTENLLSLLHDFPVGVRTHHNCNACHDLSLDTPSIKHFSGLICFAQKLLPVSSNGREVAHLPARSGGFFVGVKLNLRKALHCRLVMLNKSVCFIHSK